MKMLRADIVDPETVIGGPLALEPLSRRQFLLRSAGVFAGITATTIWPVGFGALSAHAMASEGPLTDEQREVLAAVQEHLFPTGPDSPGATEVNAVAYLETVLTDSAYKAGTRRFARAGIGRLIRVSDERYGSAFPGLAAEQKDELFRYLIDETRWGEDWLSRILYHIFEALLGDPIYGINPDGVGWAWLDHTPGFPRPPADKIYGRL